MAEWDVPDFSGSGGSSFEQPDFAGSSGGGSGGGNSDTIAPVTAGDAELWRSIKSSSINQNDESKKSDLGSFVRDYALAAGTSIFKAGTQALTARVTRAVGPGSNPLQQGPSGRSISVGGVPVTLTATQAAKLGAGQTFNLTQGQRAALASKGVNAPKNLFGSGNAAADAGGSPNTLYFILAGGVLLLLFYKR